MDETREEQSALIPLRCPLCIQDDYTLTGERPNGPHVREVVVTATLDPGKGVLRGYPSK